MKKADKSKVKKYLPEIVLLLVWQLVLLLKKTSWINLVLAPVGAIVGHLIMEINWLFPDKKIKSLLPIIILPLTLFVLTSTSGVFGKTLMVFLNLRLLLDKKR